MAKRVGVLTGGGDCPGLNAALRAIVRAAFTGGWEVVGLRRGFDGILERDLMPLDLANTSGIIHIGGTILGTSSKGRFSAKTGHGVAGPLPRELLDETKAGLDALDIAALIAIGGDGTLTIAQQMHDAGIKIVGVPKTIDNDLEATVITFGFDSAVACATDAIDRLHTTAASHDRVMVLEVMGRYAGWIALHAGIAGGADVILIPEIPFSYAGMEEKIRKRAARGKHFAIFVVAEGARAAGGDYSIKTIEKGKEATLGGAGEKVAAEIAKRTDKETRTVVLGHLQRGGGPTTFDRLLATRYGAAAFQAVADGHSGVMVALRPPDVINVPLVDAIGKLRTVPPDGNLVRTARALGITLGNE